MLDIGYALASEEHAPNDLTATPGWRKRQDSRCRKLDRGRQGAQR